MAEAKGSGPGYLPNGSLWVTPTFDNAGWFPYGGIKDQMIDAQLNWAKGAGAFAGNNVPKFNGLIGSDPNGTFGGGFATTFQPTVGGGLLGKTAYSGGFNPFAGRGNGGPGAGGPPPAGGPPAGTPAPPGGPAPPSPFTPGSPMTRPPVSTAPPPQTMPPGGVIPAASGPPTQPGSVWNPTQPGGTPPPGGIAGAASGGAVPVKMTPTSGPPRPGGLLGAAPTAGPSIMPEGWGSPPPAAAMQNPQAVEWARSSDPQAAMRLQEMYGPLVRAQMDMYYNQGGAGFDPAASAAQSQKEYSQPMWIGEKSPEALQYMISNGQAVKGPDGRYYYAGIGGM